MLSLERFCPKTSFNPSAKFLLVLLELLALGFGQQRSELVVYEW